ncbi:MAG: hypothetical protein K0Q73_7614 [Paenibacillus sp.]|jgi:septation ring formation regulator EzrA|nr:hypothetical protein [Paenibacillus sp.]
MDKETWEILNKYSDILSYLIKKVEQLELQSNNPDYHYTKLQKQIGEIQATLVNIEKEQQSPPV